MIIGDKKHMAYCRKINIFISSLRDLSGYCIRNIHVIVVVIRLLDR